MGVTREYVTDMTTDPSFRQTDEYLYKIFYCVVHIGAMKLNLIPFNVFEGVTIFGLGRVATAYGLDGPGIESRWGRDFSHLFRPALRPTRLPVKWIPGLSRG